MTLLFCLFVLSAGCFTFPYVGGDLAIANLHLHAGHCTLYRQRDSKNRLSRCVKWVFKSGVDTPYDTIAIDIAFDVHCDDGEICVASCKTDARKFLFCVCGHKHIEVLSIARLGCLR